MTTLSTGKLFAVLHSESLFNTTKFGSVMILPLGSFVTHGGIFRRIFIKTWEIPHFTEQDQNETEDEPFQDQSENQVKLDRSLGEPAAWLPFNLCQNFQLLFFIT